MSSRQLRGFLVSRFVAFYAHGMVVLRFKAFLFQFTGKDSSLTALAAEAARGALQMAQVEPDDVDLVLMCTSTPEDLFGNAPQVCVQ